MSGKAEKLGQIIAIIERETGTTNVTAETRLGELPLDSLEMLQLLHTIEDELKVKIPDAVFHGEAEKVADVVE